MTLALRLPAEILIQVLENIPTKSWTDVAEKRTLRNCCLVHSTWRRYAQPLLFRDFKIERFVSVNNLDRAEDVVSSLNALLECIEQRPELTTYIHNLLLHRMRRPRAHHRSVRVVAMLADQDQCIISLLPKIAHLKSIGLYDVHFPASPPRCSVLSAICLVSRHLSHSK